MEEGWKVFQKYPNVFASENFLLKRTINLEDPLPVVYINLINKKSAIDVINKNISHFREKYGPLFDPEKYLASLEHIAYEQENLVGVLMGYGVKSGWTFHRDRVISQFYQEHPEIFGKDRAKMPSVSEENILACANLRMKEPVPDDLSPSLGFTSLAEELNFITEHRTFFDLPGVDFSVSEFDTPMFACLDCDEELDQLRKKYGETLRLIKEKYKAKSILEITVAQWQKK